MVSRKPTNPLSPPRPGAGNVAPTKPSPSPAARRRRTAAKRRGSLLKYLASAPAATFDFSLLSCRRRLLFFARLAVLGSNRRRRRGVPAPPLLVPSSSAPSGPRAVRRRNPPAADDAGEADAVPDLDETLIHAHTDPPPPARYDFAVRPVFGGRPSATLYVAKRPGVDAFLRAAADRFEVVAFTAGLPEYASLVLDRLDPRGEVFAHRLYRGACRNDTGDGLRFVKDLAATGRPLDSVLIVDDNPSAYALQPENAVPVAPFLGDDNDRELQRVMAFLDAADGFDDTREAIKYHKKLVRLPKPAACHFFNQFQVDSLLFWRDWCAA